MPIPAFVELVRQNAHARKARKQGLTSRNEPLRTLTTSAVNSTLQRLPLVQKVLQLPEMGQHISNGRALVPPVAPKRFVITGLRLRQSFGRPRA
jgi:hypothetical protein